MRDAFLDLAVVQNQEIETFPRSKLQNHTHDLGFQTDLLDGFYVWSMAMWRPKLFRTPR